jgi:hypothetical protein
VNAIETKAIERAADLSNINASPINIY